MNSLMMMKPDISTYQKHWGWFLTLGIAMVILGIAAISLTALTTIISVISLGILILMAGIFVLIDAFSFWWGKWGGFVMHLILGLLYFAVGVALIDNPILGSISITLFLGWFYLISGIFRAIYSFTIRAPQWKWLLINAIVAIILGGLILANWPGSSLFIIGLFVGIDLIFYGWAYIMIGVAAKNQTA